MRSLLSRLSRSPSQAPSTPGPAALPEVLVYTRADCGCCKKALDLLEGYRRRGRIALRTVDVDSDPALADRYGGTVPVVLVGGTERFRGLINPVLLDRLLDAEGRRD
jgi:glutaredoxin